MRGKYFDKDYFKVEKNIKSSETIEIAQETVMQPITEVAKTSGFGGYNHFFRAFKKEYGMTPKEYFHTTRQDARG